MKILALEGSPDCGKTETLNIVYQFLLSKGYNQVSGFFLVLGNPKMRDFRDILENNEQRIGIVTQGDYVRGNNSIASHLKILFDSNCDIIICACTTKNPTAKKQVAKYAQHTFFIKSTTKISHKERLLNYFDAEQIMNRII